MTLIKKSSKPASHKTAQPIHHAVHHSLHHAAHHQADSAVPETSGPMAAYQKPITAVAPPAGLPLEKISPAGSSLAAPSMSSQPVAATGENVLDTRQEFFKLMSEKIKEDNLGQSASVEAPEINKEIKVKSVHLYRKIAVRFIILALILVAIVGYFALTKLTIVITPKKETASDTLNFSVTGGDSANSATAIKGNIARIEETVSGTYPATGVKTGQAQFVGQVKITNKTAKGQPLVATTRLLTADQKLFRIKNSVNVPAGGSVTVDVYPDKPGADMAIAPTHFTIPGLFSGLQDKIYGDSSAAFSLSTDNQKVIQQSDIDNAKKELSAQLIDKVKQSLGGANSQYDQVFFDSNPATAQITLTNAKVGDVIPQFAATVKNVVNVVSFASTDVVKLAQQKAAAGLAADKTLSAVNKDSLAYALTSYDATANLAAMTANFDAQVASSQTDFVDKTKLVNLSQSQLESYLQAIPQVSSFDLQFFPPFIKRAPSLVDRIKIEIQ